MMLRILAFRRGACRIAVPPLDATKQLLNFNALDGPQCTCSSYLPHDV